MAYRGDGARLDKLAISTAPYAPQGMGEVAENACAGTSIHDEAHVPGAFELGQNYPNPFNPTTSIAYYLPRAGRVTLEVFDAGGRRVATVVEEVGSAGRQTLTFDGSALASGVYFYRLATSSGSVQSRTMVLTK